MRNALAQRLRLLRSASDILWRESRAARCARESLWMSSKKKQDRCVALEDFEVPNQIQPGENSMGGAMDGATHERALGRERELERRRLERRDQLAFQPEQLECWQRVRFPQPCTFPAQRLPSGGVFAMTPFRQPPIMRPTSSMRGPISANCFCGISLASHAICMKNRSVSVLPIATPRRRDFSEMFAYVAARNVSRRSRNSVSIFAPIPNRSSRALLRRTGSHVL